MSSTPQNELIMILPIILTQNTFQNMIENVYYFGCYFHIHIFKIFNINSVPYKIKKKYNYYNLILIIGLHIFYLFFYMQFLFVKLCKQTPPSDKCDFNKLQTIIRTMTSQKQTTSWNTNRVLIQNPFLLAEILTLSIKTLGTEMGAYYKTSK